MVTFGTVKDKKEFALLEPGEYVLTLSDIEEVEGQYGDRIVWKFLIASKSAPTDYFARDDGQEKTLWAFSDPDIIVGSLAHEFIEGLTGQTFGKDSQAPSADDLLGKRIVAYVSHETPKTGKNAGVKREKIVAGSIKPYRLPGQKANGTAKRAPDQVTADAGSEDIDRALVVSKLQAQVKKLLKLDPAEGERAQEALDASDLDDAPLAELQSLLDSVTVAVMEALDA
jgi:hypothetical protein